MYEIVHKRRNVFVAFSQRRNPDRKNFQTVVQIAAEFPRRDHRLEIPVRRRNQAHIHFSRMRAAEPLKFALLQGTKQLRLDFNWNVPDFIQK